MRFVVCMLFVVLFVRRLCIALFFLCFSRRSLLCDVVCVCGSSFVVGCLSLVAYCWSLLLCVVLDMCCFGCRCLLVVVCFVLFVIGVGLVFVVCCVRCLWLCFVFLLFVVCGLLFDVRFCCMICFARCLYFVAYCLSFGV